MTLIAIGFYDALQDEAPGDDEMPVSDATVDTRRNEQILSRDNDAINEFEVNSNERGRAFVQRH